MKAAAQRVILKAFQQAIRPLGPGMREPMIAALAPRTRLRSWIAEGEYGPLSGSVLDADTLRVYAGAGTWASRQTQMFVELLRDGGTYLDIGGNIGMTVIPIAQNPAVDCHVFEPSPENLKHLRWNLAMNGRGAVQVHPVALMDRCGEIAFELDAEHSGDNRVHVGQNGDGLFAESSRPVVTVDARRLDDEVPDVRRPLGIKIDAQGAEPFILAGGERTFAQATLVALEFWPYGLKRLGGDVSRVIDYCCGFPSIGVSRGDSDETPVPYSQQALRDLLTRYIERTDSAFLDLFLRAENRALP